MMRIPATYGLCDPYGEVRYVGQSLNPSKRLRAHCNSKERTHVGNWVRSIIAKGVLPEIFILEEFDGLEGQALQEALDESEIFFIGYFTALGCRLTNRSKGGYVKSGWRHSPETRSKMSIAHRGHSSTRTPEWNEKIRLALIGKKHTEEWKWKASLMNSGPGNPMWGKRLSEEHRNRIRVGVLRQKVLTRERCS